ncbi:hypothetical protein RE474_07525 [Methanolobus sediminis]|uniref:Uncharacterized protein n=1 Tax=Methanolobus sediminis TaxID=3072978 RepID=A0AA51YKW8_9EURY|nr:hypothetical protein [Methanolobus sediminis]WMW23953.1 hypothetical protein RE474_07525 [Methanolobus sediminis]
MALLLLSCTATNAYASMFELEVVPISTINKDPTVYDSTMAYRKISVIGNITELSKQSASIEDSASEQLKIDVTKTELFEGFNASDEIMVTGEYIYDPLGDSMLTPTYVLHYPTQDLGLVNISDVVADTAAYNGKYMIVAGNITSIEMSMGRYTLVTEDDKGNRLKVFFYGSTELEIGDRARITGLYNGRILHSESMGLDKSPLSISTLVPGFSSIMGTIAVLSIALLLKSKQRKD